MNLKRINSCFNELNNAVDGKSSISETEFEKRQRRLLLESSFKSYKSFVSSNAYELMDDDRLMEVPSLDFDRLLSAGDVINRMTDVIKVFYDLKAKLLEASTKICKSGALYFHIIQKKYDFNYEKMDKRTEEEIVKNYKEAYKEIMGLARKVMFDSNFIEALIVREYRSLKQLQMGELFTLEEMSAKKDKMVDPNLVDYANDIESSFIAAFWLNKVTKLIDDCKQGYMVERVIQDTRMDSRFKGLSKEEAMDLAELRYKFLNSILRDAFDSFGDDHDFKGFNLSEYIMYLYYKKAPEDDPALIELFEEDYPEKVQLYEDIRIKRFTKEIMAYEQKYNEIFSCGKTINDYTFINDLQTLAVIQDCVQSFYDAKSELTAIGMLGLAVQEKSNKMITGSPRWGIIHDDRFDEIDRVSKILIADIPGYLKPVSLHVETQIYEVFKNFKVDRKYEGEFVHGDRDKNSGYSTNAMFKLSSNEQTKLKQIVNKKKFVITEKRRRLDRIRKRIENEKKGIVEPNKTNAEVPNKKNKKTNLKIDEGFFARRAQEEQMDPNVLMRSLMYDMELYKIQREMCAVATREYAKWLSEDKIIDAPLEKGE